MARKLKKAVEVQKFGGEEHLGDVEMHGHKHEVNSIETQSRTSLEQDAGIGNAAVIRCFEFAMNPEVFTQNPPTHQELFANHANGIRIALWKDGLEANEDIAPRVVVSKNVPRYRIFVTAKQAKGHILPYDLAPQTLSQIVHGN